MQNDYKSEAIRCVLIYYDNNYDNAEVAELNKIS